MLVVRPGITCDKVFFIQAPKYTIVHPEKKNAWSQVRLSDVNIFYLVLCLVILTEESVSFSFVFIQLILRQLN